jgi:DNA-binding CsgD family transcriptional regulator
MVRLQARPAVVATELRRAAAAAPEPQPVVVSDRSAEGPQAEARASAPPPLRLALRIAEPGLAARAAARLAEISGAVTLVAPPLAEAVLSDAAPTALEPLPSLVLAAGPAALAALRAGARAVLSPEAPAAELAAALGALRAGLLAMPPEALAALLGRRAEPAGAGLTPREQEVLGLLAAGASNKLIARRLGLSFHTVKAHVAAVLAKLGAGSRADAVARGARAGLVLL